jgi:enoyl-CoA hydratase/carnithine racemase
VTEIATPVRLERDGDVAVVVLDNPPLNLFDELVFDELERLVRELVVLTEPGQDGRARAVLFEARGKHVSGGVDVGLFAEIAAGPDPAVRGAALWARLLRIAQTVEELPVPTVFAAHGLTLTAAFELSLACDILLAAERATFGLVEIVVGLTPSMGGPQRLAERAGPARAKELVFTGERYPAAVLERWNVVNRVLPDDGFAEAARDYARRVSAGPTLAHAATKRLVGTAVRDGVRAADDVTPAVSGTLFGTADLRGAIDSFLREGPAGRATPAADRLSAPVVPARRG